MDDADSPTTNDVSRRAAALRTLADGQGGPRALEEALRVFGNERELVLAAHARWQTHLLARLDQALEQGRDDPHVDVLRAVEGLGRTMPGLAGLLDAHADDPVLDGARRRLADYVGRACPCGRPHPLVAPAAAPRHPVRCVVRRAGIRGVGWGRRLARLAGTHCGHRPAVRTWQYS